MACYHWQIKMSKISISSFLIMHTIHLWSITIRLGFYNSIFLKSIYFLPNISFTVYFLYTMFFFLHLRCIILPAFNVSTLLIKFNLDFKFGLGFTLVSEFSRYQLSAQRFIFPTGFVLIHFLLIIHQKFRNHIFRLFGSLHSPTIIVLAWNVPMPYTRTSKNHRFNDTKLCY